MLDRPDVALLTNGSETDIRDYVKKRKVSGGKLIANYWLSHVYPPEIGAAHRDGDLHIHDLDMLAGYCAGWSLRTLLHEGLNGVPGKVEAGPPRHLSSPVGQIVNFLGTLRNHFSAIGVNGINEMIRNYTADAHDITTDPGQTLAVRFLDRVRERMVEFQEQTGHMYNLEATPAEGTTYRFAREDRKRYPGILQAGTETAPFYTNSSQLPVGYTDDAFHALAT